MRVRIERLLQSGFLRDVAKLSLGTIGGRLIGIAALPLVTRLYTPEDFSLLAVYLGLVSTIGVAACLRLEIAIPLAETDEDAAHLLVLSFFSAMAVCLALFIVALTVPTPVADALGVPDFAPFVWLVPLGVLLAATYSTFQFWATRARRFGSIARTRVSQAAIGVATMLGFGWVGLAPLGLLVGNMLNIGAGGIRLAIEAMARERKQLSVVRWPGLARTMRAYRRYPIYSTPESLINMAGLQVPVLLIAAYGGAEAGFLFLAMQLMAAPMRLLGSSISQVYMSRAGEEMRAGRLAAFTLGIMRRLIMVGVGPLILVGILAPTVFPWVFGADWARAGVIMAWMIPWMALQFVVSPVSTVMFITGRQRQMLGLTIIGFLQRGGAVMLSIALGYENIVQAFVVGSVLYYVTVFVFVAKASGFDAGHYRAAAGTILDRRVLIMLMVAIIAGMITAI